MLLKIVREGLGRTIVLIDQLTRPTPMTRTADDQRAAELAVQPMALYQYFACPFCIKTRRAIHRLNLPIALRDAQNDPEHRSALANDGGKLQVPCLRIDEDEGTRWLYESGDIIGYLEQRFGAGGTPGNSAGQPPASSGHSSETPPGGKVQAMIGCNGSPISRLPEVFVIDSNRFRLGCSLAMLWFGLFAGASAQAQQNALHAYECTRDGVKSFSDEPCGRGERRVFLGYSSPRQPMEATAPEDNSASDNFDTQTLAAEDAQVDGFIDRLELKRAIARAEGHISDLQKKRDAEIDRLRARMTGATMITHAASAPGTGPQLNSQRLVAAEMADKDLAEQVQVINTRYAEDIAVEEHRLDRLREHLESLERTAGRP